MKVNFKLGVSFALASSLCYAILNVLVKFNHHAIPIPMLVFFQSLIALACVVIYFSLNKEITFSKVVRTSNLKLHILRTMFSVGISYFLFSALKYIPLADAVLLANTSPLIVPIIGYLFLSQPINNKLWLPIFIGFVGVIIILKPDREIFNQASLLAVCAAICMASSMLLVRRISVNDSSLTSVFYYFLISTIITALALPIFWIPIHWSIMMVILTVGVLFFLVQYFLTKALEYVGAQIVSLSYYSCIIFSALLEYFVFNAAISINTIGGIILISLGGILCIRIQSKTTAMKFILER